MSNYPVSRRRFFGQLSTVAMAAVIPTLVEATDSVKTRKLGVALVGLGGYSSGQLGPALRETEFCRLAAVVTGDAPKGRRWAREYAFSEKFVYGYDTMERLADNPEVDIIYVVTPPGLHAQHVIAAAKTRKHVICEKPMATSVPECDAMIAACRTAGVRLFVGYRLHFEPHHLEFKRIAQAEEFGAFKMLRGANGYSMGSRSWRVNKKLAGGGPLMDMGVYVIQAACMAKNEQAPVAVTARVLPVTRPELFDEVEEAIVWTMEFADGATAECRSSYAENISEFRAEGAEGWAELRHPAFYYRGQRLVTSTGERRFNARQQQAAQLDAMAQCVLAGRPCVASGEMGRRDLAVVEAIYRAAKSGQRERVPAGDWKPPV
ncbi:Gfo/Idh/MocA family protein [Oleiharenicola lentus]|uniref:Gfo/Idh/MocA family protein n=1 Tax=Oleiharenicola lentus TaxID=2508720 RepID=UPI003F668D5C